MPTAIIFKADDISMLVSQLWWPLLRVSGFMIAAPIIGSTSVPVVTRVALSLGIALIVAPMVRAPAGLGVFSALWLCTALQQVLIGLAIGLVVQLAFDALTLAGQTVSMTMGLGYATLIDPQRGASTAVLGELFTVFATLAYLAIDGHLTLIGAFTHSFVTMPIGQEGLTRDFFGSVATWGAQVFESGLLIALPATVALIVVNLALGVVTRAAPQLNLFSIGFPITMLAGYFVLIVGFDGVMSGVGSLIHEALNVASELTVRAAPRVH